jgi:uncharacterized lipoprotein YehR (DUF1307 family)
LEYEKGKTNGNTPNRKNVNKQNVMHGFNFKDDFIVTDNLNPLLNSMTKENTKMEEKKIVNNKPSQYRPIIGVNFHNLRK